MSQFAFHFDELSFQASYDYIAQKLYFRARAVAHEGCLVEALGEESAQSRDKLIEAGPMEISIKGFECGFVNSTCPFCREQIEEGMEIAIWSK